MLVGYQRVTSVDADHEIQLAALRLAGCKQIYQDRKIFSETKSPNLNLALESLKQNDTLVIWRLNHLASSIKGILALVNILDKRKIHLTSISDNLDTSSTVGRFFFQIAATFSQVDRDFVAEKTKIGLTAAKDQGRIGGRQRKMTPDKIKSAKLLLSNGSLAKDVAQNLGVSVPTLYRWLPASIHEDIDSK